MARDEQPDREASPHHRRAEGHECDQRRDGPEQHGRLNPEDRVANAGNDALRQRTEHERIHHRLSRRAHRVEIIANAWAENAFQNGTRLTQQSRTVAQQEEHREHCKEQFRDVASDAADQSRHLDRRLLQRQDELLAQRRRIPRNLVEYRLCVVADPGQIAQHGWQRRFGGEKRLNFRVGMHCLAAQHQQQPHQRYDDGERDDQRRCQ